MTRRRRNSLAALALAALGTTLLALPGDAQAAKVHAGTVSTAPAHSVVLGEDIAYNVYLPYGYQNGTQRDPVLDAGGVFGVGSTPAGLPGAGSLGGLDGRIARYDVTGARQWVKTVGGAQDDALYGVAVTLAVHLSDSGRQLAVAQFGSSADDGVDPATGLPS